LHASGDFDYEGEVGVCRRSDDIREKKLRHCQAMESLAHRRDAIVHQRRSRLKGIELIILARKRVRDGNEIIQLGKITDRNQNLRIGRVPILAGGGPPRRM
jgi:hypothetical protein